jgi:uncharacterized OsmC-like protein
MLEQKSINGIDVAGLSMMIEKIKEKPEIATFRFRTFNTWINNMNNRAMVKGFYGAGKEDDTRKKPYIFEEDEPHVLLGGDKGANPVEYLLVALSGCLTTSLVAHASVRGIDLEEVESTLEGELDIRGFLGITENVRRGFKEIRVTFKIKSDAPKEKLLELIEHAKKRSPVFDMVSNPTPVRVTLE